MNIQASLKHAAGDTAAIDFFSIRFETKITHSGIWGRTGIIKPIGCISLAQHHRRVSQTSFIVDRFSEQ